MKENPMETNKKVLIWLCMCAGDKSTDKQENRAHVICIVVVFATTLTSAITSAVYFFKFVSIDFGKSLYALFQMAGAIGNYLLN